MCRTCHILSTSLIACTNAWGLLTSPLRLDESEQVVVELLGLRADKAVWHRLLRRISNATRPDARPSRNCTWCWSILLSQHRELDAAAGCLAARLAALNALGVARGHLGSLDHVSRVVRLGVVIATAEDVRDRPTTLAGYDWGGRAACLVAALWPERCVSTWFRSIASRRSIVTAVVRSTNRDTTAD